MRQLRLLKFFLTLPAIAGCAADPTQPSESTDALLGITLEGAAVTRSSGISWEEGNPGIADLYVFNEDGSLDVSGEFAKGRNIVLQCTPGVKDIYAVVNKPRDPTVPIVNEEAMNSLSSTLGDNSPGSFVMAGKTTATIARGRNSISIPVTRVASKIVLRSVTNGIEETAWKDKPLTVKAIYLVNVPVGPTSLFGPVRGGELANKGARERDSGYGNMLSDDVGAVLSQGETYGTEHTFYSYSATAENTRLVVETQLGGRTFYYPLTFGGGLQPNHQYTIENLTIKKLGSASPDSPVTTISATFDVTVSDWKTIETENKEY